MSIQKPQNSQEAVLFIVEGLNLLDQIGEQVMPWSGVIISKGVRFQKNSVTGKWEYVVHSDPRSGSL